MIAMLLTEQLVCSYHWTYFSQIMKTPSCKIMLHITWFIWEINVIYLSTCIGTVSIQSHLVVTITHTMINSRVIRKVYREVCVVPIQLTESIRGHRQHWLIGRRLSCSYHRVRPLHALVWEQSVCTPRTVAFHTIMFARFHAMQLR